MVESLRPSILDHIGLFAALRWQLKEWGRDSVTVCTESYPAIEPKFALDAAISLFRIAQGALAMISNRGVVKSTDLRIYVADGSIWLIFTDDGTPVMLDGWYFYDSSRFRAAYRHDGIDAASAARGPTALGSGRNARSWRRPVGTVTRKQPLQDLGKTPARARSVALQNPDQVEPIIWPMGGTARQLAGDFRDQPRNGGVVPDDQRR
jgi:hypothetical protein